MIDYAALGQAIDIVFQLNTLLWLLVGISVGIGVGAMPGLQASTAVALMLPLTFTMPLGSALGLLIGLYKGAIFGGSISAISFSTPGTPEAAATVFDGYKLMRAGKGRKALLTALYSSITADLASDVLTIMIAPMLAIVALKFGPAERFWVMMLAITLIGSLSGDHLAKGLFSAAFGLFIGTIGTDPIGAISRNTFGLWWLSDGIPFPPMLIGVFAMAMVFNELLNPPMIDAAKDQARKLAENLLKKSEGLSAREFFRCWKEISIGFGVGSFVGLLPGLGATAGAFLSYAVARYASPSKGIGSGKIEGIAAAEAGNNATVGPTLVPLLAFGIPGSATAALIGGALVLQGATPSPRMFELFPHVIYALFIILIVGNIANLGLGRIFAFAYAKIGEVPKQYLIPVIGIMAIVGSYVYEENPYHVLLMLIFGLVGLVFRLCKIPEAPMVITFLLAPLAEENIRRALLIGGGDWVATLMNSPISIALAVLSLGSIVFSARVRVYQRIAEMRASELGDLRE
ncbi:MAG: tripartite tricarboxylate transporter permease [Hyphomicrobiaceae bacterium]|nr:tripartite tricarboxylate transporter permease [Hyphomicrobiaceae bacterium]